MLLYYFDCKEYKSQIWGGFTHIALLDNLFLEFLVLSTLLHILTLFNLFLAFWRLHHSHSRFTIVITMLTVRLNYVVAYPDPLWGEFMRPAFLHILIIYLSTFLKMRTVLLNYVVIYPYSLWSELVPFTIPHSLIIYLSKYLIPDFTAILNCSNVKV